MDLNLITVLFMKAEGDTESNYIDECVNACTAFLEKNIHQNGVNFTDFGAYNTEIYCLLRL